MTHSMGLVFDAREPSRLAQFWATALGYEPDPPSDEIEELDEDYALLVDPEKVQPTIAFVRVPEEKSAKNRLHLDIMVDDRQGLVQRLVEAGGTVLAERPDSDAALPSPMRWTVMQDPEGNELCISSSESQPVNQV